MKLEGQRVFRKCLFWSRMQNRLLDICSSFVLLIALCISASAQVGFLSTMRQAADEPNSSFQLTEREGQYIICGQYFDQTIGRWTTGYTFFDTHGQYLKHRTELMDTVSITFPTNTMLENEKGLYKLSIFSGNSSRLVHYNFDLDSVWVTDTLNTLETDFAPWDHQFSRDKSSLYFCGRNLIGFEQGDQDVKLLRISDDSIIVNRISKPDDNSQALQIRENSRGEWIVACRSSKYFETGLSDEDFTYMLFFDSELNLLSDKTESGRQLHFGLDNGMVVDKDDNILVTGNQFTYDTFGIRTGRYPSIAKYDSVGNLLWQKRIGNSQHNLSGYGNWKAVIESKEKDGYILVGSESYESEATNDTLISRAAIAKVSYEGDSIWYRTYSYRAGAELLEGLNDVIISSDGQYVAAGVSYDFSSEPERPWSQSLLLKTDDKGIYLKEGSSNIEIDMALDIKVYPNPVSAHLYISQAGDKPLRVSVADGLGRIVDAFTLGSATHTQVLNTSSYFSGTYYLRIEDHTGHFATKAFVVEN